MIYQRSTFQQLTAPGYFDFSGTQTAKTAAMVAWFDGVTADLETQANLFDETFRLWATRDYSAVTVSRHPWLLHLMKQNGIDWFHGSNQQAAALLSYVTKSYPTSIAQCFQELFDFLVAVPIEWITTVGDIATGYNTPVKWAETLVIYSTAGSLPATPSPTAYTERAWSAPASWSKTASSATFYSRGYLSGGDIVWLTPRSTTGLSMMSDAANLASMPGSPATGDLCGVKDDGTGDVGAIYCWDGAAWRKTTTPNENQGMVGIDSPKDGSGVFAPTSGYISSEVAPPASGPTQGYGFYGIYGGFDLRESGIFLQMALTTAGVANLGMIITLARRIKPTLNALFIRYTTPTNPLYTTIEIADVGAP